MLVDINATYSVALETDFKRRAPNDATQSDKHDELFCQSYLKSPWQALERTKFTKDTKRLQIM